MGRVWAPLDMHDSPLVQGKRKQRTRGVAAVPNFDGAVGGPCCQVKGGPSVPVDGVEVGIAVGLGDGGGGARGGACVPQEELVVVSNTGCGCGGGWGGGMGV